MPALFSDIDNTLIQSHRHTYHGQKVWVEYLNGHEQSYMPQNTYDYFRSQNWLKVIPVTTRTKTQYERLTDLGNSLGWDMVLICNGAILLKNGKEDCSWTEESLQMSMEDRKAFIQLSQAVHGIVDSSQIIEISDIMLYVKTEKVEEMYNYLFSVMDSEHIEIHKDARKVYCFPKSLNKGTAIERMMKRLAQTSCIAAGDSEFDISMLEKASIALCPEKLSQSISIHRRIIPCSDIFPDTICHELEKIKREENYSDY